MGMAEERKTNSDELHHRGQDVLLAQTRALDAMIHELHCCDPNKDQMAIRVPILMLQAVGVSIHSILTLTKNRDMAIRDGFGIARSAVETAINAAYIAAGGDSLAEQAVRHMRQKRWRDLRREANIGGWQMTVSQEIGLTPADLPGLPEALEEYTNKRGREVRDWTTASIEDRVNAVADVCKEAGLHLGVAVFAIYRPSSELLHGSYYGVNYFWQGSRERPALNRPDFDRLWLLEHFVTLLSAVFFAVRGVIEAMAEVHKLPHHSKRQGELSQQLSELIEDLGKLDRGRCE